MIFPSCIWDIWINSNKRNHHKRNEKSETLEKEKYEVINHFSLKNCSLIKYLYLRWRMTIFHYPFTKMKLSASYPLLSLIISFINLDQGSPFILKASTRKVLSKSWTIKFWCSKKKVPNSPCWKRKCANTRKTQARKNKSKKKKRKREKNESQLKREHQK